MYGPPGPHVESWSHMAHVASYSSMYIHIYTYIYCYIVIFVSLPHLDDIRAFECGFALCFCFFASRWRRPCCLYFFSMMLPCSELSHDGSNICPSAFVLGSGWVRMCLKIISHQLLAPRGLTTLCVMAPHGPFGYYTILTYSLEQNVLVHRPMECSNLSCDSTTNCTTTYSGIIFHTIPLLNLPPEQNVLVHRPMECSSLSCDSTTNCNTTYYSIIFYTIPLLNLPPDVTYAPGPAVSCSCRQRIDVSATLFGSGVHPFFGLNPWRNAKELLSCMAG